MPETQDDAVPLAQFGAQIRKETLFTDNGPKSAVEEIQQIADQLDIHRPRCSPRTVPQARVQTPRGTKVTVGINASVCGNKPHPTTQDNYQTPHKEHKTAISPPIIVKGAKRPAPTRIRPIESEQQKSPDIPQPRRRRTRQNAQEAQLAKTATLLDVPRRVGKRRLNAVEDDEQDGASGAQVDQGSVQHSIKKMRPTKKSGKK